MGYAVTDRFSSLSEYAPALTRLLGPKTAEQALDAWLAEQIACVRNPTFANRFRAHFGVFSAPPSAYAHRVFDVDGQETLGGIRFYGGDRTKPFVDVLAWSGPLAPRKLGEAVRAEWAAFRPFALRLLLPAEATVENAVLDQTLHAARVAHMAAPQGGAKLALVVDIHHAAAFVAEHFATFAAQNPALASELHPASAEDLTDAQARGRVRFIEADQKLAGLIAFIPETLAFLPGWTVLEEIVAQQFRGRGLAAEAQRLLAQELAAQEPAALMIGTIHRDNAASRKAAERAGRPAVFKYVFVAL